MMKAVQEMQSGLQKTYSDPSFFPQAKNTELIKKSPEKGLEDYIRFGKEYYAGSLVYIKKSGEITMVNLVTGEQKEVNNNK